MTITISKSLFHQAKIKACREQTTASKVSRELLTRWVAGDIQLDSQAQSRDSLVALARSAQGIWADRDPDTYLAASRDTARFA